MQATVAGMPEPWSTTSSFDGRPVAARLPPAALAEFAQPLPAVPLFPQGQGVVWSVSVPSPAQKDVVGFVSTSTSPCGFAWKPVGAFARSFQNAAGLFLRIAQ